MFLLKIMTVVVIGILTFRMLTLMLAVMQASRVRVKAEPQPTATKKATRLTQDPRTGIYYPEH